MAADGNITVNVSEKNTGKRAGEEVVQFYVKHLDSKVERPAKTLHGFQRVALRAGETKTVTIPLPAKSLSYWDEGKHAFLVENAKINLMVGGPSAEVQLEKTVNIVH